MRVFKKPLLLVRHQAARSTTCLLTADWDADSSKNFPGPVTDKLTAPKSQV